jgi:hypothetical protein
MEEAAKFAVTAEGVNLYDLEFDLMSSNQLVVDRSPGPAAEGAKGPGELTLLVGAHLAAAGVVDLARLLLGWIRRKPGAKLEVRCVNSKRTLTLKHESKLVDRDEIERLASELRALAGIVGE